MNPNSATGLSPATRNNKNLDMNNTKISADRLKELERKEAKLQALENGGVDNWQFIDEALKGYRETVERDETIEEIFNEIAEVLADGAHEPSERGAGFVFADESMSNAVALFTEKVNGMIEEAVHAAKNE